ncbi:hypothetical protein BMS3Abin08_01042 [bacterium BMS3Abin08]|nr:hypothetical protein BMS3Abin08_01042 [bacterium BMS3Abin08]
MRKHPLINGKTYHVFTRSIAGYEIFRSDREYNRILNLLKYYKVENPPLRFSVFEELKDKGNSYHKYFD